MISQIRKTFKKKKLVLLYLDLMEAKTYLLEDLPEKCYEALLKTQKKLEKERKIPKKILSLLNEVWSSYQWKRENYDRCHQALLSFLVYSDLNKLSQEEKKEVIYRLITCNQPPITLINSITCDSKFIEFLGGPETRNRSKVQPNNKSAPISIPISPLGLFRIPISCDLFARAHEII